MDRMLLLRKILRRREIRARDTGPKSTDTFSVGDIAFLLLIFFIVTSSFILREGIFFSLPARNSATVRVDEDKLIEVEPRNDGFRYRGMLMGRDSMVDELKKLHKNDPERVLIIVMAWDVKYERLVDTLSVARETGIGRVSLKNAGGGSL